jgi:hypothetical protein
MFVDTSAKVVILLGGGDADALSARLQGSELGLNGIYELRKS